jgi:hypothetical protein
VRPLPEGFAPGNPVPLDKGTPDRLAPERRTPGTRAPDKPTPGSQALDMRALASRVPGFLARRAAVSRVRVRRAPASPVLVNRAVVNRALVNRDPACLAPEVRCQVRPRPVRVRRGRPEWALPAWAVQEPERRPVRPPNGLPAE